MISRTLTLTAVAASCLLGCATDDLDTTNRGGEAVAIVPIELRPELDREGRPIPGTLDIDTSEGRLDVTSLMPERPREFRSWDELNEWLVAQLNAEIIEGEDGVRRAQLSIIASPAVRYDAQRDELVDVDDVAEAVVGGTFGYVLVDGALVCTSRTAACAREQSIAPEASGLRHHLPNARRMAMNGFEIEGATWITHMFFYHNVGSETRQVQGGFQVFTSPCGFFQWCTTTTGTNSLATSLIAFRQGGSIFNFQGSAAKSNVRSIRIDKIEWGPPSWGSQGPGLPPSGIIASTTGVCARHHGGTTNAVVDFQTSDGVHPAGGC